MRMYLWWSLCMLYLRTCQRFEPQDKTEPYPELQSAVATLSMGPVGPGDAINLTDRDTLMRCCAADGLILKPSRPATAIDAMFLEMGFGEGEGTSGEVWSTYTDFGDFMRFGIVFAANVSRPFNITPTNVGFSPMIPQFPESRVFVRNIPDKVYNFNEATPFDIGPDTCNTAVAPHFCLFYTAPVLRLSGKEVIVLGELEKWVPMSARRVLSIRLTSTALTLTLGGQPGERIAFSYLLDQHLVNVTVRPDSAGCAAVHIQPTPATTAATTTNTTTVDETTTEQWHYSTSDASAPATEPSSSHSVVKTTENLSAASAGAGTRQGPVSPSAAHALQNSVSFKAAPSSSLGKSPASSSTGMRRRRSPIAASSEPLGGTEFVRVFGTAPEKSCRFVPPPFTPPPPSPSATTPKTTATTPTTSPKHTSSPGPGGGASRLRLSVVIVSVTLISHILKL